MSKVVIFNCPPRSGKDTVRDYLWEDNNTKYLKMNFKDKLFSVCLTASGISSNEFMGFYEVNKDVPWEKLGNLTPRQFLIKTSEEYIKPIFGNRYFGDQIVNSIKKLNKTISKSKDMIYLISDGGFKDEVDPLIESLGKDNVLILQWDREGCTFENDSRDYITAFPTITRRLPPNNGTVAKMANLVDEEIRNYFYR